MELKVTPPNRNSLVSRILDTYRVRQAILLGSDICIAIIGFLISTIFATGAGSTILGVFDAYLNNFALLFAILLECIIFGWIYKFDDLRKNLECVGPRLKVPLTKMHRSRIEEEVRWDLQELAEMHRGI